MVTPTALEEVSFPDCVTKVAFVAPEGMVTEAGTVTTLELVVRAMASAADAGPDKETVQVVLELLAIPSSIPTWGSPQLSPERRLAGSTIRVAAGSAPFHCARIVAAVTLATDVVVAVNVPAVWPAAIVKVAGTVTCAELLDRLIDAPPEPALADRFTVHVLGEPPATVAGKQLTEEIVTGGSTVSVAVWEEPL